MKIIIEIKKSYSDITRQNFLYADISTNKGWLKQVYMDNDDLQGLLSILSDTLIREELKYSEHDRCDHDENCCCQFNPLHHVSIGGRGSSECCPVHNNSPSECLADKGKCQCQQRANNEI